MEIFFGAGELTVERSQKHNLIPNASISRNEFMLEEKKKKRKDMVHAWIDKKHNYCMIKLNSWNLGEFENKNKNKFMYRKNFIWHKLEHFLFCSLLSSFFSFSLSFYLSFFGIQWSVLTLALQHIVFIINCYMKWMTLEFWGAWNGCWSDKASAIRS